jgi:glycosyltransferase involved in cell wall biosynthesis
VFALVSAIMAVRALVQRFSIRHAGLLVCISSVFRDHIVKDYGYPPQRTVVVPNPVRLERFDPVQRPVGSPPLVLVLGRVAARKGVENVVSLARLLLERGVEVRFRIVGGTSLWSNYVKLLDDLPVENSEYAGRVRSARVPQEIAESDVLLQPSKYEPFALTVAEALAAGVPVVGTTEVGAVEGVDRSVAAAVEPGDVEGLAAAILATLERLRADRPRISALARAEAERLFAPDVVCAAISAALERLVDGDSDGSAGGRGEGDAAEPPTAQQTAVTSSS